MRFEAIIFDFDGVLLESEFEGNQLLAELLTRIGHPTTPQEAVEHYVGLSGRQFIDAVEARIGRSLPPEFHNGARELGVEIGRTAIIEDSKVGATGALASGATVIGLAAGRHCFDGHADMLRAVGVSEVALSFGEVAGLVGLDQTSK